jgi:hypothetical protein
MAKRTKNHRKPTSNPLPYTFLTEETLALLLKALGVYEARLQKEAADDPLTVFAIVTLHHVKAQVQSLRDQPTKEIAFDYNEVVILHGALLMYGVSELWVANPSPPVARQMQQCQRLISHFSAIMSLPYPQKR